MCGIISACFTDCNVPVYDSDVDTINNSIVLLLIPRNNNNNKNNNNNVPEGLGVFPVP